MSTNYLYKRNNIYYFRLRIPKDLKHVIPASEIKKSLKSCTKHKAKSLAKVIGCKVEETFMLLRSHVLTHEQQIEVAGRLLRLGSGKAGWVNRAGKLVATLTGFAAEIGIDKRIVKSAFVKMMENIAAQSMQLFAEYRGTFGDLVIFGDIARVIDYRITKGRQLAQF